MLFKIVDVHFCRKTRRNGSIYEKSNLSTSLVRNANGKCWNSKTLHCLEDTYSPRRTVFNICTQKFEKNGPNDCNNRNFTK